MKKILLSSVVALALVGCATTSTSKVTQTASNIIIKDGVTMIILPTLPILLYYLLSFLCFYVP